MASAENILARPAARSLRGMMHTGRVQEVREAVSLALDALRSNPLRSALTILGIVIGISSIITVSTIINAVNDNVLGGIRDLGTDVIICFRFPFASLSRPPSDWFTRKELQAEWAEDLARLPAVAAASPSLRIFMPQFGSGSTDARRGAYRAKNVILQGNSPEIEKIFEIKLERGRWFNQTDMEHRLPVVILGNDTARTLFPVLNEDPVGQEVTIVGQLFTVVGVAEKRKQGISGGKNPEDNIVLMPITTLRKLFPNNKDYVIFVKAKDPNNVAEALEEVRDTLRRKRRLTSDKPDNFALFTSQYFLDLWDQISKLVFILLFAVASVTLLIGGIGVMNIMLVSVTERTREIGVRKAIGAKRRNILLQFLLEAVTLCAVGGAIGVFFGSALGLSTRFIFTSLNTKISLFWIVFSFTICATIGIIFGIYPAWKASKLDPVEALRYE